MDRYVEYLGLISVMLLSTALAGCPSKCICSKNAVRCTEKSLMDVPNFDTLDNNPVVIDLSSNEIDYIAHYALSFDKAEIVKILYLNDSKIIDIDDAAFKELIHMRELYLSSNLLSDLPPNSFKYNDNLLYLDLSNNLFRNMPKLISSTLQWLNMMNSGIENVRKDSFNNLPNLNFLNLQKNSIRYIDVNMLNYLPKLTHIELEFNAWKCTCESVNMLDMFYKKGILKTKALIQCKTQNDFFISILNKSGVLKPIKDLCIQNKPNMSYNFGGEIDEMDEIEERFSEKRTNKLEIYNYKNKSYRKAPQLEKILRNVTKLNNTNCEYIQYITSFTFSTYAIFSFSVLFAFIVGLTLGSIFFSSRNVKRSEGRSCDSLLKRDCVV